MRGDSFGKSDVAPLAVFVAATEQNDNISALPHKVQPIAWPVMNAHFGYPVTDGLDITEVAHGDVPQAGLNANYGATVSQTFNPPRERVAFNDIEHGNIVNFGWQLVKGISNAIARATGARLDSLPMNPGAVLEALWEQNGG